MLSFRFLLFFDIRSSQPLVFRFLFVFLFACLFVGRCLVCLSVVVFVVVFVFNGLELREAFRVFDKVNTNFIFIFFRVLIEKSKNKMSHSMRRTAF